MPSQLFDVFQQKRPWPLLRQYSLDLKKQCSPRIGKSRAATDDAECLARKACRQNIMIRYVPSVYFRYVTGGSFAKIRLVGLLAGVVDLRSEYTFAPNAVEGDANPADAREQVCKCEI